MSAITVSLHGDAVVRAALERAPVRLAWHVDRALARAAGEIARQMKQDAPKALSTLTNSIDVAQTGLLEYRIGPHVQYARYVEKGTRGRGWPPTAALRSWLRIKGITPRTPGMTESDLVYVMQRSIHAKGTPAQPFVQPIADSAFWRQRVQQLVDAAIGATVREIVA